MGHPEPLLMRVFMPQRSIRFPVQTDVKILEAVRSRGFHSPTKFIRYAVEQELTGRGDSLTGTEERLAATIEQMRRELFRLGRGQQALFAYVDSLAKTLLTCIPEPPQDAKDQAIARAKERHNRLVKSAGTAMVGDSRSAMRDLVNRDEQ
jgi:Arc/MetJ-type ribon-helix-helix transcriptional regulator